MLQSGTLLTLCHCCFPSHSNVTLSHSARAQAGPASPRLCCCPGPATPRAWGGLGAWPGQAGEAVMAFPEGQGRSLTGGPGLPRSALAAAALSGPAALESTAGWRACSSGCPAAFLGSGSRSIPEPCSSHGTNMWGCQGWYLSLCGRSVSTLICTSLDTQH